MSRTGRRRTWTDAQLLDAVAKHRNFTEVLRALGLRAAGGNHGSMKRHARRLGADTSHFDDSARRAGLRAAALKIRRGPADVFRLGSVVTTRVLRTHALRLLVPYRCAGCENDGRWRGDRLTLQLHHCNGRHDDDRLENLEWRCPNRHSQTAGFAGRSGARVAPREADHVDGSELFSPRAPR